MLKQPIFLLVFICIAFFLVVLMNKLLYVVFQIASLKNILFYQHFIDVQHWVDIIGNNRFWTWYNRVPPTRPLQRWESLLAAVWKKTLKVSHTVTPEACQDFCPPQTASEYTPWVEITCPRRSLVSETNKWWVSTWSTCLYHRSHYSNETKLPWPRHEPHEYVRCIHVSFGFLWYSICLWCSLSRAAVVLQCLAYVFIAIV